MKRKRFMRSMLEYYKIILLKISFDRKLFRKEYRKAFQYLNTEERATLSQRVRSEFRLKKSSTTSDLGLSVY